MVAKDVTICPRCGGNLKHYGMVSRIVRTKNRATSWVKIRRLRCVKCGAFHREIPGFIFPYKQYESEVIVGVVEGLITHETLGFEDYPCELTMTRWCAVIRKNCTGFYENLF